MKDSSTIRRYKVKENTIGPTVELSKAIGLTTSCMVEVFLRGQMGKNMKESMLTTKSKVLDAFIGQTDVFIEVNGLKANSMAKVNILIKMVKREKANGKMEKD
jgi:hypothetical protein